MNKYYVSYAIKPKGDIPLGYGYATVTIEHMSSMANVNDAKKMILEIPEHSYMENIVILNWKKLKGDIV